MHSIPDDGISMGLFFVIVFKDNNSPSIVDTVGPRNPCTSSTHFPEWR